MSALGLTPELLGCGTPRGSVSPLTNGRRLCSRWPWCAGRPCDGLGTLAS